jgi:hypothetical protein
VFAPNFLQLVNLHLYEIETLWSIKSNKTQSQCLDLLFYVDRSYIKVVEEGNY